MRYSCYQWNPKRFCPEFSGIATRYSGAKRQRLSQQKRRKQLESDHCYTLNLNQSLDKTLESRVQELHKLQQARERHLNDLKYKEQLNQQRRQRLESLRERNNHIKKENKKNIDQARKNLLEKNQNSRIRLQQNLHTMNDKKQRQMGLQMIQKSLKCRLVRQEEEFGQSRVNNYHRGKNQESLQMYLQKIHEQDKKRRQQEKRIRKYEKNIKTMSKTVLTKKEYLQQVELEISKLRTNLKGLSSVGKLKKKMIKMTEESEDEKNSKKWKADFKNIANPEDGSQLL